MVMMSVFCFYKNNNILSSDEIVRAFFLILNILVVKHFQCNGTQNGCALSSSQLFGYVHELDIGPHRHLITAPHID
jgi:hypothetical protein